MGTILAIFLKILQIIGIVLLSVLGLIFFTAVIILFVPVRYKAEGEYDDGNYKLDAAGSWLMHILSFSFCINNENKGLLTVKIFGKDINKKKNRKKSRKKKNKKKKVKKEKVSQKCESVSNKEASSSDINENDVTQEYIDDELQDIIILDDSCDYLSDIENVDTSESEIIVPDKTEETEDNQEALEKKIEENSESDNSDDAEPEEGLNSEDNLNSDEKSEQEELKKEDKESNKKKNKPKDKSKEKDSKESSSYGKINRYIEIIKSDEFKASFALCKKQLHKLLKAILPKKWNVKLDLAFSDPEKYGKVMEYYGMFFALLYKHVDFSCLPQEDWLKVSGYAKGRIFIITILLVGIKIYFNKNIRKLLKMLKVEDE